MNSAFTTCPADGDWTTDFRLKGYIITGAMFLLWDAQTETLTIDPTLRGGMF